MKIFINETNCNLNNKKEIIAGLLIFFLPIIAFLRPYNFIQLNLIDIKFLFVGHFLLLLLIASISFLVSKFSNFKFSFLLFLFCTFIYLQFFFDFFSLLSEINHIFIFILFEFLCLVLITFVYKFKVAFLRFTLIYSTLLILYHISNIIIFSFDYNKQFNLKNINEQFDSKNLIEISNNKKINKKNVYFIVFDGMMSLDTASSIDIVNEKIELTNLKNLKLRYINNSFSNYSASWTNLAAIFKLDYPIKEKDLPPKNLDNFFPFKLYTSKNTNLIKYLRKVNTTFFWGGNRQSPCREINVDILCMQKNKFNNNILNLLSKFYFNTPLRKFFFLIYKNNNSIYPSDLLTSKNLELDKSQNKFYFYS